MEQRANNGYSHVERILKKSSYRLEDLLQNAGNRENFWLEFKGAPFLHPGAPGVKEWETQDFLSWNILEAVISLANTAGGAVVLGLDDDRETVVPLLDKDTHKKVENFDKFIRDVDDQLFGKLKFSFKTAEGKPNTIIELSDPVRSLATPLIVTCQGEKLLLLLVKESPNLIFVKKKLANGMQEEVAFRRRTGDCGRNLPLQPSEIQTYSRPSVSTLQDYISNIPKGSSSFVGRRLELEELDRILQLVPRRIPLILGPAGTGKTALAYYYSEISREKYDIAIKLPVENMQTIPEAFLGILNDPNLKEQLKLHLPEEVKTLEDKFKFICQRLMSPEYENILILLDNLDHPEMLSQSEIDRYLSGPGEEKLHIYATTRLDTLRVNEEDSLMRFPLQGLCEEDGVTLLENKRKFDVPEEREAACGIVRFLNGNAWALDLLGESLKQKRRLHEDDYRNKLEELKAHPAAALQSGNRMVRTSHGCLDAKLLLQPTFDLLSEEAQELAFIASLCAPDYVWCDWLKFYYEKKYACTLSRDEWEDLLYQLFDFHILLSSPAERLVKMHRLTREVLKEEGEKHLSLFLSFLRENNSESFCAGEVYAFMMMAYERCNIELYDFIRVDICCHYFYKAMSFTEQFMPFFDLLTDKLYKTPFPEEGKDGVSGREWKSYIAFLFQGLGTGWGMRLNDQKKGCQALSTAVEIYSQLKCWSQAAYCSCIAASLKMISLVKLGLSPEMLKEEIGWNELVNTFTSVFSLSESAVELQRQAIEQVREMPDKTSIDIVEQLICFGEYSTMRLQYGKNFADTAANLEDEKLLAEVNTYNEDSANLPHEVIRYCEESFHLLGEATGEKESEKFLKVICIYEEVCRLLGDQKKCLEYIEMMCNRIEKVPPIMRLQGYLHLIAAYRSCNELEKVRNMADKLSEIYKSQENIFIRENSFTHAQTELTLAGVYADDETCASLALEHLEKYKKIISHPDFKGTPLIQEDMLEKAFAKLMKKSKNASS